MSKPLAFMLREGAKISRGWVSIFCYNGHVYLNASNCRQDSAVLLEGLVTIVSKNPNYYSPDLTTCSLANLKTKIIPREDLKLLEEIGEGAFGKVYKGE